MFRAAGQAEIIRSKQKDDFYSGLIKNNITDLAQYVLGPRQWIKWHRELDLIADVGYLVLTTFAGLQTLGEEYVSNIQVDYSKRAVPSKWRRLFMITLQVGLPYGIDHLLQRIEKRLNQHFDINISAESKAKILQSISVIRNMITVIHRCHLVLFYWQGIFYHLAKRMSGIHYIKVRRGTSEESRTSSYKILALLCFSQLLFTFLQHLYKLIKSQRYLEENSTSVNPSTISPHDQSEISDEVAAIRKCALCLEVRRKSTATPCGHLFCWDCIYEWCQNKPICPLCREKFELSRLIFLQNYL